MTYNPHCSGPPYFPLDKPDQRLCHTRHILPPSEIDLGLFLAVLQAQKGNTYFTELAERVEYGNYANLIHDCVPLAGYGGRRARRLEGGAASTALSQLFVD